MKKTILLMSLMALTVTACKKAENSKVVVDTGDSGKVEVDSVKVDTLLLDVDTIETKDTLK